MRSVASGVSLYSESQATDVSFSSAESIGGYDEGFEERRRERARRMPSFIWSDAQQSDITEVTSLGRRNL